MNLRHIWGDATCGSDLVSDTPTHNAANYGVPAYPLQYMFRKTSRNDDELYGLYRRQECLCFQTGKKSRMGAIFLSGGARASFGI
jgi:hypothetical protein